MSDLRLVVCGSRSCTDRALVERTLEHFIETHRIVRMAVGDCRGPDGFAMAWADRRKITCAIYRADWSQGPKAGPLRNQEMIAKELPDHVLAFWDGASPGTLDTIRRGILNGAIVTVIPGWLGNPDTRRSEADDGDRGRKRKVIDTPAPEGGAGAQTQEKP